MIGWIKRELRKKRIKKALCVLQNLEGILQHAGISRQERREFWRKVAKDASARKEVVERLAKESGIKLNGGNDE